MPIYNGLAIADGRSGQFGFWQLFPLLSPVFAWQLSTTFFPFEFKYCSIIFILSITHIQMLGVASDGFSLARNSISVVSTIFKPANLNNACSSELATKPSSIASRNVEIISSTLFLSDAIASIRKYLT